MEKKDMDSGYETTYLLGEIEYLIEKLLQI